VIYTIWQNSETPDTYYSCSDVLLTGAGGGGRPVAEPVAAPTPGEAVATPAATTTVDAAPVPSSPAATASGRGGLDAVAQVADESTGRWAMWSAVGAVGLLAVVVAVAVAVRRRRRT
jgi:chitin-binding protein